MSDKPNLYFKDPDPRRVTIALEEKESWRD